MKALGHIGIIVSVVALIGLPAMAQEPRYKPLPAQTQTGDMSELVKKLRSLTDEAERSKAADPAFINDLRNLANAYDNPWPLKLLSDNFRDGDFTKNPAWTVVAGTWQVDAKGRLTGLHSAIAKAKTETTQGAGGSGASQIVGNVLETLRKQQQQGQGAGQPAREEHATIFAPVGISNAFSIRLELASGEGGRFDFGPAVGPNRDSLYRITYMPEAESGLVLSRVTPQGTQLLASSNGKIVLEDDKSHVVEWKRDRAGKMTVALDGKPQIEATDMQLKSRFDGFLMDNGGGSYWIRSVEIAGVK